MQKIKRVGVGSVTGFVACLSALLGVVVGAFQAGLFKLFGALALFYTPAGIALLYLSDDLGIDVASPTGVWAVCTGVVLLSAALYGLMGLLSGPVIAVATNVSLAVCGGLKIELAPEEGPAHPSRPPEPAAAIG